MHFPQVASRYARSLRPTPNSNGLSTDGISNGRRGTKSSRLGKTTATIQNRTARSIEVSASSLMQVFAPTALRYFLSSCNLFAQPASVKATVSAARALCKNQFRVLPESTQPLQFHCEVWPSPSAYSSSYNPFLADSYIVSAFMLN